MIIYFILSVVLLLGAYILKILRQSQFIEIYECPKKGVLSKALSLTFLINFIFPFRLGNIFRIFYVGKNSKYGKSFALSTVLIDLILDLFVITFVFEILFLIGLVDKTVAIFFAILSTVVFTGLVIYYIFSKLIKKIILCFCGIFNENIKLKLLKSIWYFITSFKDLIKNINKLKLIFYTFSSMCMFLLSFFCLSIFFNQSGIDISFTNIFYMMYGNLNDPLLLVFYKNSDFTEMIYMAIYFIVPIIIIFVFSYLYKLKFNKNKPNKDYLELLPHIKTGDRLNFLEQYFSSKDLKYFRNYLDINHNIAIIEDYSAGSNATTMLCCKDGKAFYRKYTFGEDSKKLYEQVNWINSHKEKLTLTEINNVYYEGDVCCYDMPYVGDSMTCFNYVHTTPFEESWEKIKMVLEDLDSNLHKLNITDSDEKTINEYIDKKIIKNLNIIKQSEFVKPLLKYDYLYINGKKYNNINYYDKYLNKEYLKNIFRSDNYSDIHGDFTIENIVCYKGDENSKGYYIIDPNTGNIHNSPFLDYAKLLQSIHGGYEFLMKTKDVSALENKIDFLFTKSNVYYKLFNNYVNYLREKFGENGLKSIFYHEIVHWLRLMPYKLSKIGERSLLFYSGLLMVLSDVEEMFEKNEISNIWYGQYIV